MKKYTLNINDTKYQFSADEDMPLLWALRDEVGLLGTKFGCGLAQCGACTVHIDGQAVRSCQMPLSSISKKSKITTIEAVDSVKEAIQNAWIDEQVPQCGYCQSGQIMSATALLKTNKNPSDEEIKSFMSGNICRCGTYQRINSAIKKAAKTLQK